MSTSTSMKESRRRSMVFGNNDGECADEIIEIPTSDEMMGLVPLAATSTLISSSFLLPLGAANNAMAPPLLISSSSQEQVGLSGTTTTTPPNLLVEALLASTTTTTPPLPKPPHQHLFTTSSLGAPQQQLLSLNRSGSTANSWAWWGGVTECLMGKRDDGHKYLGMKMKKIMKGRRRVREPRFSFKTMSDVDVLDDGYKWRKYGQKVVKNTQHPRSYYRCTQDNCRVKKRVERLAEDPRMVITTYEGRHVHSPSNDLEDSQTHPSQLNDFLW